MEVRFQMVGSESPNTIAVVKNEVDINAFRKDPGWYEVTPDKTPEPVKPVAKKTAKKETE